MLMPHITQKYKDNLDAARNANHSLAVFIKVEEELLSLYYEQLILYSETLTNIWSFHQ